ncbi:MAG: hypothetical protein JWO72_133, partial [Caulobacteraceae bacterium]|nr:hypothetical protein [Caulobacteraceae bacterium]
VMGWLATLAMGAASIGMLGTMAAG